MSAGYVELHAKSFYSFGSGASHVHELLARAVEYGYAALALTDANLCCALEFARLAGSLGVRPVTGGELSLTDGSRVALLVRTREGYANLSRLFTLASAHDCRQPRLNPAHLPEHVDGVTFSPAGATAHCLRRWWKAAARIPAACSTTTGNGSGLKECT